MFVLSFLLRRLLQGSLIILLVAFIIFTLLRVVPGDPARLIVGGMAPDEVVAMKAKELGLDRPIPIQFLSYLTDLAKGDLGTSFVRPKSGASLGGSAFNDQTREERAKVLELILDTLPMTLQLAALALAFALLVAVPLGTFGGLYPGRWPDKLALTLGSICVSTPRLALTRRKIPFDRLKLAKGASARRATLAGPPDTPAAPANGGWSMSTVTVGLTRITPVGMKRPRIRSISERFTRAAGAERRSTP